MYESLKFLIQKTVVEFLVWYGRNSFESARESVLSLVLSDFCVVASWLILFHWAKAQALT